MRIDPLRFDRYLCATRPVTPAVIAPIAAAGVHVICLERRSTPSLAAWWPLVTLLRRHRIDVLHAHKFGSNFWGTTVGRLAGVPVIVAHEHTWSYQGNPVRRVIDREVIARGADVMVAVSREDRRRMIEVERIDPRRIRFVPNGIPQAASPDGPARRAELGIPPGAPVIGSVASLRPQKALHVLIESAAVLERDFPDLRVLIVGEGPERARLESLIRARGLTRTVFMLGQRSDVASLLSALDVAVLTSDWEGSPLSVLEYMAAGCPVVATRVGGVPDLVRHGVDGLLAEAGDIKGLAGAIGHLLSRPERRATMGANGRRRQRLEFSIDQMLRRIETLYEELVRGTMRARSRGAAYSRR